MGKQLPKEIRAHPGVKRHRGAENFAQHFSLSEVLSPADLTRAGPTLPVTRVEVSHTLLRTAP